MKKANKLRDNCIISQTSCSDWSGGDIEYLGICQGDPLDNVILEIVGKLQDIAGEDLSSFDLDALLDICGKKEPKELTLLSILNIIKENHICLKDYITSLQEVVSELSLTQNVNVNMKCFADIDNLGNVLSITRDQLDQIVIDNLCSQKKRIETLEAISLNLQSQIDVINNDTNINEATIATCVDTNEKPVSSQVISIATRLCDLETIVNGLSTTLSSLVTTVNNIDARVTFMEENCCAATCDDIKLGFTALFNEDASGLIIRFTWGAGTKIPSGFVDKGSVGTITDRNGNTLDFNIDIVDNFTNSNETEVIISGLDLGAELEISITAKIGTDTFTCEKCLYKTARTSNCGVCTVCTTGSGTISIVYSSATAGTSITPTPPLTTTTTTTSTTTTTTTAP